MPKTLTIILACAVIMFCVVLGIISGLCHATYSTVIMLCITTYVQAVVKRFRPGVLVQTFAMLANYLTV